MGVVSTGTVLVSVGGSRIKTREKLSVRWVEGRGAAQKLNNVPILFRIVPKAKEQKNPVSMRVPM